MKKYAPADDLKRPYAELSEVQQAHRALEAMEALAEVRLPGGDPMELDIVCDKPWGCDYPCDYSEEGECPWGKTYTEECECPNNWIAWRASVGYENGQNV